MHVSASPTQPPPGKKSKYDSAKFLQAQETAHSRFDPSIFSGAYLLLRNIRRLMEQFFSRQQAFGKVLDVGAQYCPYYPLFKDKCESYTSMDVVDTPLVDLVCNAEDMPLNDNFYDLILCTEVLEHTANPQRIVDECYRVLKPGGVLIITVPSIFPIHGYPADNWRFMPDGLRLLLRSFSQVQVLGELDFAQSLASVNLHYGHVITGKMGALGRLIDPLWHFVMNSCGIVLSLLLRPVSHNNFSSFTTGLWAEARK
jgi:SAM-dependent methyltransferase